MSAENVSKLNAFIQASKAAGASDETLANLLVKRGWPADDVYGALAKYWSAQTGIAIPEHVKSSESAREAFLYLLAFSTLCSWATALGAALFRYIEEWFPDPVSTANYLQYARSTVTWQMATLAISFPIFLVVMRAIVRENANHPEQLQSGVRRWLTYIALLVTAGTMIGDLIWFLNYLLSGEITVRFFLKSLVVMTICGGIFLYYLRSLRPPDKSSGISEVAWHRSFALLSIIAVVTVFCVGFTVAGSPRQLRAVQADKKRVEALKKLQTVIKSRYDDTFALGTKKQLPADLQQLTKDAHLNASEISDPETKKLYGYKQLSQGRFQLCADFMRRSEVTDIAQASFWWHDRGHTCYTLDANLPVRD